ncbi:PREDICTED: uncharacterized protein LOC109149605 [Ipomoea nil]|uniref:uncharacterized protein LOC109149605 n=1 Tax=Ipomoea nil TaxID=35883 RepID=UPI0009013C6B|nr:PREDICTED: uncharacterized protein LOC109149605 [Ipomoea nil]
MENVGVNDDSVLGFSERTVTEVPTMPASGSLSSAHHFVSLKLTSRNYLFWQTQMLPFLEGQGLLGFVDGTTPFPTASPALTSTADSTPAAVSDLPDRQLAWRWQDKAILSMLISSLSEETLRFAVGKGTSRQLWQVIEQTLGSSTRSRALRLLGELQGLRQGDSSISDYLGRAQMLIDELALAGRHVELDDQNLYVFRGLHPEFRPLVATLARGAPVPLPEVADFLVSQEWICSDDGATLGAAAALAVSRGDPGGRCGSPQNRGGGGRGRGRGSRGRGRSNSGPRCQICNKQGYIAKACWRRFTPDSDPQANVVVSGVDGSMDDSHQWFPDTGATNHATPDPTLLTSSIAYDGLETLRVGNGTCLLIVTVGSTSLATNSRSFCVSDVLHVPGLSSSLLSVQCSAKENNVPAPRPEPWGVAPVVPPGEPSDVSAFDPPTVPEPHRQQPVPAKPSVTESERTVMDQPPARPRG